MLQVLPLLVTMNSQSISYMLPHCSSHFRHLRSINCPLLYTILLDFLRSINGDTDMNRGQWYMVIVIRQDIRHAILMHDFVQMIMRIPVSDNLVSASIIIINIKDQCSYIIKKLWTLFLLFLNWLAGSHMIVEFW